MAAYALADIVTMGGSFSQIGGHNPLEPALFKNPIIVGHDMSNFTEVLQQLLDNQGIVQLAADSNNDVSQLLCEAVVNLLENDAVASELGSNAHQVVLANQGASQLSLDYVQDLMAR